MVVFGRTWYGQLVTSFGGLWRPSHLSLTSHLMALRSHRGVPRPFEWSRLARWMLVMQCGMLMGNACANLEPCPRMPAAHQRRGLVQSLLNVCGMGTMRGGWAGSQWKPQSTLSLASGNGEGQGLSPVPSSPRMPPLFICRRLFDLLASPTGSQIRRLAMSMRQVCVRSLKVNVSPAQDIEVGRWEGFVLMLLRLYRSWAPREQTTLYVRKHMIITFALQRH
ncbi:uncharacterized protein CLUP02_09389 [Colletotrichum lupini]|uniref:Uncharacterized protein n=1 Tax=Colletotrichum lupini TaxID=145971 RepID=A0A9Q8SUW3_9PEZI|nr:uncharacterized protein CLUP02_09389 [Colletotrichum lupini]UQC83893.1 hypothetical protein CLUP02_09389 [Colletotrichum lupini]